MRIRKRALPSGWYPETSSEILQTLKDWELPHAEERGFSCIVPHAGWFFSGRLAFQTMARLRRDAETVVVVGGHLSPCDGILSYTEEGYETPLGDIPLDEELLSGVRRLVPSSPDRQRDNTVEVQLPLIKYLFPSARVCCFRASPSVAAIHLGRAIHEAAASLRKRVIVVGSTDLTHYGPNYGFYPQGGGKKAYLWVREVNDKRVVEAFLACDAETVLKRANEDQSACSAGGAVAAMEYGRLSAQGRTEGWRGFTGTSGKAEPELIGYLNSYEVYPQDSFVGYAGVVF
jgi:AmmeMemoRadiSam system protein B